MSDNGNPGSLGIIIKLPDFKKLKADVEKLRTELSMLVLERDDLLFQECKNIEMVYMLPMRSKNCLIIQPRKNLII